MFTKLVALPGENFFTQVPTHWLRDPRASAGLKAVLSYWQSHAIGYRVTIEQTIAEMSEGRDAVYAYVREGIELGYLRKLQDRGARGRFGALEYTLGPAAYEQQYVRNWGPKGDGTEGPIIEREPGEPVAKRKPARKAPPVDNSASPDVSAGRTAYGSAGNGQSVNGASVSGGTVSGPTASGDSDTKKINPQEINPQEMSSEVDQNPPRSVGDSLPREAASRGGDLTESEKRLLSAAVQQAVEVRAGQWSMQAVVDAMQVQLDAGAPAAKVATAMIAAAADSSTNYPGRIGYLLKAGATAASPTPAPEWAQGAMKYLDAETPRCRVSGHRAEPEIGCGKCKADAIAAKLDEPEPAQRPEESPELPDGERLTGAALARKIAAGARTGASARPRRLSAVPPSTTEPPARVGDLLGAAAKAIGGAA